LKDDHRRAREIGVALKKTNYVEWLMDVDTNIIIFKLSDQSPAEKFAQHLNDNDILAIPIGGNQVRMVTHLDVDDAMTDKVIEVIGKFDN
jgi:threonine aldolase